MAQVPDERADYVSNYSRACLAQIQNTAYRHALPIELLRAHYASMTAAEHKCFLVNLNADTESI